MSVPLKFNGFYAYVKIKVLIDDMKRSGSTHSTCMYMEEFWASLTFGASYIRGSQSPFIVHLAITKTAVLASATILLINSLDSSDSRTFLFHQLAFFTCFTEIFKTFFHLLCSIQIKMNGF